MIQELTAADRCDRCLGQAVIAVSFDFEADSSLLFCSHHAYKHKEALRRTASTIWDARGTVVFDRKVVVIP